MRILTVSMAIGPLMLIGALQAAVGQPIFAGTSIQVADGSVPASDRDTYVQKTSDEMQGWQQKLQGFLENAKAKGQEESSAAAVELNEAWAKTQSEAQKLQTAGQEGWESAKLSYEKASHELSEAWDKLHASAK